MERKASLEQAFRFAEFEVNPRAGELRKLGVKIKLQEHPLQVLAMLLEHPGQVVTREELQQRIWPADTFVDFESGLNKAINKLRVALGDSAENPRFVETLPRHGYRFIATADRVVESQNLLGDAAPPPLSTSPPQGGLPEAVDATISLPAKQTSQRLAVPLAQRWLRLRWVAVLALALFLTAVVGLNPGGLKYRLFGGVVTERIRSIAVLPLATLSQNPDQEYFAEGMTDALITDLGKIAELRVISRTSVMRYKGTKKSVQEIARELQVDALVEGTVTRSGDRVRITANLVQASPEKHLWADSFEGDLRGALALQDHVASAIANGIQIRLTPQEQTRLRGSQPVDADAIEAYLKGRFELSRSELDQSVEHFKEALLKEPNYAQAWAGLAAVYDALSYIQAGPSNFRPKSPAEQAESQALNTQLLAKAKAAALKALQLDESLSEAHASLGQVLMDMDWSWGAAETEFQRAIALDHSNASAHREYGENLMAWGRLDEALAELNRASVLDPFSWQTQISLARTFSAADRYDDALQHWHEALALGDPLIYHAHRRMAIAYEGMGMEREAVAELVAAVKAFAKEHGSRRLQDLAAEVEQKYISSGYAEAKKAFLRGDLRAFAEAWHGPIWMAEDYAELGENDKAFEWLNKAILTNNPNRKFIKTDDRLTALRTDPRFRDLIRNLGFPPTPGNNGRPRTR